MKCHMQMTLCNRAFKVVLWALLAASFANAAVSVTVNTGTNNQEMTGFGSYLGTSANKIQDGPFWVDAPIKGHMDSLAYHIGLSIFRMDANPSLWPGEDQPFNINGGTFGYSKTTTQWNYVKMLYERGVRVFIATVWSPPGWMKISTSDSPILNPFKPEIGGGELNPQYYTKFAEYCVNYVTEFKKYTGIDLYAFSIQNETAFRDAPGFSHAYYSPSKYVEVVKVVGAALNAAGLGSVKLYGAETMGTLTGYGGGLATYLDPINADATAKQYFKIGAVHSYVDGVEADPGSASGWGRLKDKAQSVGVPLWMTETSGYDGWEWSGGMKVASAIHWAVQYGNVSGWVYWGLMDRNENSKSSNYTLMFNGKPQPPYYGLMHYARFVRQGAKRVNCTSSNNSLLAAAFKNTDNSIAVVIVNNTGSAQTLTVSGAGEDLYLWTSSNTSRDNSRGKVAAANVQIEANTVATLYTQSSSLWENNKASTSARIQPRTVAPTVNISNTHSMHQVLLRTNGRVVGARPSSAGIYLVKSSGSHSLTRTIHLNK